MLLSSCSAELFPGMDDKENQVVEDVEDVRALYFTLNMVTHSRRNRLVSATHDLKTILGTLLLLFQCLVKFR